MYSPSPTRKSYHLISLRITMIQSKHNFLLTVLSASVCVLAILFIFVIIPAEAQNLSAELTNYNIDRLNINKKGMLVLSGWALTNMAVGSYGYYNTDGRMKYFHQMNTFWNVVNLSIGALVYYQIEQHLQRQSSREYCSIEEARSIENILLLNIGLNVGYIATGGFLWERGIRKDNRRLLGYRPSLVLQGGFLLVFDSILYSLNRSNNQQLFQLLEQIQISGTALSVRIPF